MARAAMLRSQPTEQSPEQAARQRAPHPHPLPGQPRLLSTLLARRKSLVVDYCPLWQRLWLLSCKRWCDGQLVSSNSVPVFRLLWSMYNLDVRRVRPFSALVDSCSRNCDSINTPSLRQLMTRRTIRIELNHCMQSGRVVPRQLGLTNFSLTPLADKHAPTYQNQTLSLFFASVRLVHGFNGSSSRPA